MSYKTHAKCRLTFIPKSRQRTEKEYSDRTVIEIREADDLTNSIVAKDVPNGNAAIFNMVLKSKDQYIIGKSIRDPDEIRHADGTYLAWLDENDRDNYHMGLRQCFQLIDALGSDPIDTAPPPSPRSNRPTRRSPSPARSSGGRRVASPGRTRDTYDSPSSRDGGRHGGRDRSPDQTRDTYDYPSSRDGGRDGGRTRSPDRTRDAHDSPSYRDGGRHGGRTRSPGQTRDAHDSPSYREGGRHGGRDRSPDRTRDAHDSPSYRDDHRQQSSNQGRNDRRSPPPQEFSSRADRDDSRSSSSRGGRNDQPSSSSQQNRDGRKSSPARRTDDSQRPEKQQTVLSEIHQLIEYIQNGDTNQAGKLAGQLADKRVRLEEKENANNPNEKPISIRVSIDRNNQKSNEKAAYFLIDVYPSTTVRELRAAFEHLHQIRPVDQYWFVNGHLAHEKSTMKELDAMDDTLFVLFAIQT